MLEFWDIERPMDEERFDEAAYLDAHPDVARAVARGQIWSGLEHFRKWGKKEGRAIRDASGVAPLRAEKMKRVEPLLRTEMQHEKRGLKYDFLTPALRAETGIIDTKDVGNNAYDAYVTALIARHEAGIVLDCGAGRRQRYYKNVVNYEIVDYDSTDVLGVGEDLPFRDGSFDAVISIAVLEHVRDPFQCAREIVRVLKPGGELICCVPFLQPLHGFPHHYYNMSPQGLRALFDRSLEIDDHVVFAGIGPIWSLSWIVQSWAAGLPEPERETFLDMPLRTLLEPPATLQERPWVKKLPVKKNFELASATMLLAHKPR
jgi:SAM-dependent methyltransferase